MTARIQSAPFVCLILLISHTVANAQTTNATLNGQVTDTSGAAVPNARVVVVNEATNVHYETKTNNDGIYVEPNLPPGIYHIEITKEGFKTVMQPGIELHVEDARAANYTLQVGATSETVTVQAQSYMMNTQDASVSTTIDRNFAENLPLNGRSLQTLVLLTPGTVLTAVNVSPGNGGSFSVNGQRASANSFTVDGVSANLGGFLSQNSLGLLNGANPDFTIAGTTQGMVSVDALQEFKIQTSTYAPEFGRQPGGQISLLTRSGTNTFHGTAFDYLRNTVFDANNWFNDARSLAKGAERQNDFGGTVGGPIFKEKTFFFFSYEGLRLLQPFSHRFRVPSLRLRQEAAPSYQSLLNSAPIPDGPEFTVPNPVPGQPPIPTGSAPYTLSESFPTDLDSYSIKVDHTINKYFHFFGRYADTTSNLTALSGNGVNSTVFEQIRHRAVTLGVDSNVRSSLENEVRLNYTSNPSSQVYLENLVGGAKPFDTSLLYPAPLVTGRDSAFMQLNLPRAFFLATAGEYGKFYQKEVNVVDNVALSKGLHQMKWGVDYRRIFPIFGQPVLTAAYRVNSENDLIAGNVSVAGDSANQAARPIYTNFSAYGQDAWRIASRLTLTYGLRWELNPPPGERDGIQPLNVIGLADPATATLAPVNSRLYKTTHNNFAPRIGLAYQLKQSPGHETIVRGGFGAFYDLDSESAALGFGQAPFSNSSPPVFNTPFPLGNNVLPVPPLPAPLTPPFSTIDAVDPNLKLPYTLQWNVSIEQGLGENQSLTASYVASAGYRLLRTDNLFDFNPNFTVLSAVRNASSSNYESLQLQFNRRLSNGLQALASYTYSHSIDNASDGQISYSASLTGDTFLNPNIDRGNSAFDLRHALRGAVTYSIPTWHGNSVSNAILDGWSLDTIAIAQTGSPVDLIGGFYSVTALPDASFQLRPNVVPGEPFYLHGSQCAAANNGIPCPGGMGLNPIAFTSVPTDANGNPAQVQGTFGRNVLRGFGAWQIDFSVHRQFNITERVNLQLRSEFFNVFNHPNFSAIDNVVGDGLFGQATATLNQSYGASLNQLYQIGGPRSIQLALKLRF